MENPYQSPPGEVPKPHVPLRNRLVTAGVACGGCGLIIALLLLERPLLTAWIIGLLLLAMGLTFAIVVIPEVTDTGPRRSRFDHVVVSSGMLIDGGYHYRKAVRELRDGKSIVHQGIIFQLAMDTKQPLEWKAAIAIAAPNTELARRAEQYVAEVIGFMRDESAELFELTADRELRVCFLESYEYPYHYIGMIFDGKLTWSLPRNEHAG